MRVARNIALLVVLLVAPIMANWAVAAEVGTMATCGQCTCDPGQCCSKSWGGGCSCHGCAQDP